MDRMTFLWAQIGTYSKLREAELATQVAGSPPSLDLTGLLTFLLVVELIVLAFLSVRVTNQILRYVGYDPFAKWDREKNNVRAWMVVGFGLMILALWATFHYVSYYLPEPASEHGIWVDRLKAFTIGFTYPAFILVHLLLFYMIYRYGRHKVAAAVHEITNHKLEKAALIAISIPVFIIGVGGVAIWEMKVWGQEPQKRKTLEIELVAEQFQWRIHYPGEDQKLGRFNYKLIKDENVIGLDFADPSAQDDILPMLKEIHLPVGRLVTIHVRSKDVLHSMYLPHFRAHIYAVPGMPTKFTFVPTITTREMRKKLGNPEFNYELACNQLCGGAHYNMRATVIVEAEEEYQAWLAKQKPFYKPEMAPLQAQAKINPKL
ncbi:MAG: cytochrome c oxidase subunit II [Bacteroidia bacterium]